MLLFATCVTCSSAFVSIKRHIVGSFLSIKQTCSQCNNTFFWESQPYIHNIPAGNLFIYICCHTIFWLLTSWVFKTLHCATSSSKTFLGRLRMVWTCYKILKIIYITMYTRLPWTTAARDCEAVQHDWAWAIRRRRSKAFVFCVWVTGQGNSNTAAQKSI